MPGYHRVSEMQLLCLAIQQDRIPRDLLTSPLLRRGSTQPRLLWLIPAVATSRRAEPAPLALEHCW